MAYWRNGYEASDGYTRFGKSSGGVLSSSINADIVSYWKMDEATAATRADSVGGNNLADTNSVAKVTGKVADAARFVAASSQFLSHVGNAALSVGDEDFEILLWVRLTADTFGVFIGKGKPDNPDFSVEYGVDYDNLIKRVEISYYTTAGGGDSRTSWNSDYSAPLPLNEWLFIRAGYDSALNQAYISVNNGPLNYNTIGGAGQHQAADTGATLTVGKFEGASSYFADADIDEALLIKRRVTNAELFDYSNNGAGATYPIPVAAEAVQDIVWNRTDGGITVTGNSLVKTNADGWGDAEAASWWGLLQDGYVEMTASETTKYRIMGLTTDSAFLLGAGGPAGEFDYSVYLQVSGVVQAYERGVGAVATESYTTGDVFRVTKSGITVTYQKNGVTFHTSAAAAVTTGYRPGAAIYSNGGTITDAKLFNVRA